MIDLGNAIKITEYHFCYTCIEIDCYVNYKIDNPQLLFDGLGVIDMGISDMLNSVWRDYEY